MNRHALALVAVVLAFSAARPARAYDLVQNGGFETASLLGWQPFNQGASGGTGSWYAKSSGNGTYSGLPISPPPAGSWEAVADNNGRVAAILYQDVTIPATTRATLSFTIWHGNAASGNTWANGSSLSPSITNQRVRVDIIPTSANLLLTSSVLALIYQTSSSTPQIVNPTGVTLDVTALAGQTVRLRFALVATLGGLIAGIDQVKLDVSPFGIHPAALPALATGDARWGDFDGDGQYEIAMNGDAAGVGRTGWIERYSAGAWQGIVPLPGASAGVAVADVNADGQLDLGLQGVPNGAGQAVAVLRNTGAFVFSSTLEPIGATNGTIAWSDCDRDGDLDALLTGNFEGAPGTYLGLNDGTGHITFGLPSLPGVAGGDAVWANVETPGIRDVVTCGNGLTQFSFGDGNGNFTGAFSQFIDMASGHVAMGDLNNDGHDEMVIAGRKISDNTRATKIYGLGTFGWLETMSGLDAVDDASVALGDVDNDGLMDVALMGDTGSGKITRIYHNNGNGTFSDMNANLPGLSGGAIRFADFDGDGDLDLFAQGSDASGPRSFVAINSTQAVNLAPAAPSVLNATLSETEITLSVGFDGFDDHAPGVALTRNFRAGTSSGLGNLIPPMSNLVTGRRLVPEPGEAGHAEEARLRIEQIGHNQSVWWDVQNVDPCYLGSSWAGEQRFVIGPAITSVADIPNDQGGHVRLTIQRSPLDDASRVNWPAAGYNLWRLLPPTGRVASAVAREGLPVDAGKVRATLAAGAGGAQAGLELRALDLVRGAPDLKLVEWNGRLYANSARTSMVSPFPPGTWEIVGSFFALQQQTYVVPTETLADSGASGPNDQTFMVTMHTTTPNVWFASVPAIGHSVDNIAPGPPTGLSAAYHTGSGNHLSWQPAPETDFESFRIYRGTTPAFTASPATLVASTPNASWTDPTSDAPGTYYKVSTTDHAGNESAAVSPGSTTAIDPPAALAFALKVPTPNPFGESTTIAFTLPRGARARLEVFDASGRRVRTLVNEWKAAGEHAVVWTGDDAAGQRVEAGVYFCRLEAGEFRATRRVTRMP